MVYCSHKFGKKWVYHIENKIASVIYIEAIAKRMDSNQVMSDLICIILSIVVHYSVI